MVAMRWAIRGIGLVSTVILARVLMPVDFGIAAMGMLVVSLLEVLSSLGVDVALIRKSNPQRVHYDTAWTFKILQGATIATVILVASPLIAAYFGDARVISVARFLALGIFIAGFENIGVVAFRKDLDFAREFRFGVFKKVLTLCVTLTLAFILQNYWALVFGIVAGQAFGVLLSYAMQAYRPVLCLKAARELWSFSQWMLVLNIGIYVNNKIDEFVVGGMKSATQMGTYNVAADLALLPVGELVMPLSRALFPGYAKLSHDKKRLSEAFINVLSVMALVAIGASFGLAMVAEDFVAVVLGSRWAATTPIIQWLAAFSAPIAIGSNAGNLLMALGKMRMLVVLTWCYFFILAPALVAAAIWGGIVEVAATRGCLVTVYSGALFIALKSELLLSGREIMGAVWRPVVAGAVMVLAIKTLHPGYLEIPVASLFIDIAIGAASYLSTVVFLWSISGRPPGAEKTLLGYIAGVSRKRAPETK